MYQWDTDRLHGYCQVTDTLITVTTCTITEIGHGLWLHIYVPLVHGYTNAWTTAFPIIVIFVTWMSGTQLCHVYMSLLHLHAWFLYSCHILLSLHGCPVHSYVMFTYHCYTCMHGYYMLVMWITVHIACHTHVFLSYGSPCILHVLLFHGTVFRI